MPRAKVLCWLSITQPNGRNEKRVKNSLSLDLKSDGGEGGYKRIAQQQQCESGSRRTLEQEYKQTAQALGL